MLNILQYKLIESKRKIWQKIHHAKSNYKKAEVFILVSHKIDFQTKKKFTGDKQEYFIMIKVSIHHEV